MTAVGPGDLVVATKTCDYMGVHYCTQGDVRRVAEVCDGVDLECGDCGQLSGKGLQIEGLELPKILGIVDVCWCFCAWKPLPPSRKEAINDLLKIPINKELETA